MKRRKGVVESLITAVLVIVVVAVAIAVTNYVIRVSEEKRLADLEGFLVDNVWFVNKSQPGGSWKEFVNVSVYNYGEVPVDVKSVYIDGYYWPVDVPLKVDDRRWIDVNYTWTEGEGYLIKVSSTRGNYHESYWTA